jgi:hypothetical protein
MHNPEKVIGKTALYFERGKVAYTTRVMITKWLGGDKYIVSDFDNPEKTYETIGWNFTIEKNEDQPTEPLLNKYLKILEEGA